MDSRTATLEIRQVRTRACAAQGEIVPRTVVHRQREEFLHLVFPLEKHDESAWGRRLHIPFQLGLGLVAVATRMRDV